MNNNSRIDLGKNEVVFDHSILEFLDKDQDPKQGSLMINTITKDIYILLFIVNENNRCLYHCIKDSQYGRQLYDEYFFEKSGDKFISNEVKIDDNLLYYNYPEKCIKVKFVGKFTYILDNK
jgi:hypothetical protein